MDWNEALPKMNQNPEIVPREEKIRETVELCRKSYLLQARTRLLTYREFLWTQLQYTRKRWWLFQGGLLLLACQLLPEMEDFYSRVRSTGVIGCLFVVLMIPELWRNRETDSTQVEAACLYSLRQVYSARITLFGLVDLTLITLFGFALGNMGFSLTEVLVQFLLPVTVTACICFLLLCGKRRWSEAMSLAACLLWGALWWLLLMNEQLYTAILPAVWMVLLGFSLAILALAVHRAIRNTNQHWEVEYYGTAIG